MAASESKGRAGHPKEPAQQDAGAKWEHDQDSDAPRTAIPPGKPKTAVAPSERADPAHDQDSEPPRTAVPPDS